jgi:DNA-damage-inducible protein D
MTGKKMELSIAGHSFEGLKQVNAHGAEYWSARDLQPLLGYSQWRRFEQAIDRTVSSCQTSGNPPDHHFAGAGKMIDLGKGGQRDVDDYHLSRFACYLIAQNGIGNPEFNYGEFATIKSQAGSRTYIVYS